MPVTSAGGGIWRGLNGATAAHLSQYQPPEIRQMAVQIGNYAGQAEAERQAAAQMAREAAQTVAETEAQCAEAIRAVIPVPGPAAKGSARQPLRLEEARAAALEAARAAGSGSVQVGGTARQSIRYAHKELSRPLKCKIFGGDPVDLATGGMALPQTDLTLPARIPLVFSRHFESSYRAGRWFGPSWTSTADQRLEIDTEGVIFIREDGSMLSYPHPAPGAPVLPAEGDPHSLSIDDHGDYTVTDPESGRRWDFAGPGGDGHGIALLAHITDRSGAQWLTFDYDSDGTPTAIRHSGGYHLKITIGGERITALHLAGAAADGSDQELLRFGYDKRGHLATVTNSCGVPTLFTNDERGRITSWTDTNGSSYRYVYDDQDRCTYQAGQAGHMRNTYTYDDTDPTTGLKVTTATNSLGHTSRYLINDRLQVVTEIRPDGATTHTTYDPVHRPLTITDPLGHTVTYSYDQAGRPLEIVRPGGRAVSIAYNHQGLPVTVTEPDGTQVHREFDESGNLTAVTDAAQATTRYGYDNRGNLESATDTLGNTTHVECNAAGLPIAVTDPLGAVTRCERDAFGRIITITDPLGAITRMSWTVEGKLERRIDPNGAEEAWTYDGEGNCTSHTDAIGGVTRYEYTHFDLLTTQTGPDGVRYEFEHDTELQLRKVTNPQGLTWEYTYDLAGHLLSETDFDGRTLTYQYDAAGRLASRRNALGAETTFERNALGQVLRKSTPDGTTTYAYDLTDRLAQAVGPDGTTLTLLRDRHGRLRSETVDGHTMTYTYDALGRRASRVTPTGAKTTWSYDEAGRVTGMVASSRPIDFTYDEAGHELKRLVAGAIALEHAFDPLGRLTTQSVTGAEGRRIQHRTYTYRADGNLTAIEDELSGPRRFDLDATGRVTAVHAAGWTERYAYDEAGNQTQASWPSTHPGAESTGPRTYTGTRITRAGNVRYEHDALGRTTLRQKTRLSRKPDTWHYEWDAEDRLTSVVTPDGTRWRYTYDPLGRRTAKLRLAEDGETVVERVDFTWDGTTLCEQTTTSEAFPHPITLTWDHQGLRPLAQTERITAAEAPQQEIDSRFFAIITDLVGTPTELIDDQGEITWHTRSTLWGTTAWAATSTTYTPLRFPGQYYDPETGLHYNYFRHYDPETARYLASDPLGLTPAPNPATYVNNPHTWTDPLGLSPCPPEQKVVQTPEVVAPKPLKPHEVLDAWENFLREGPYTNIHPRTGMPDPDRLVSADGWRSIRLGSHEMNSKPTKFHFHMETWTFESPTNTWIVDNTMVRVPLGLK
ncbi:DUF6531 domain-containing protein [Streptomyces eurythermus]|uniref:DUF6531 domain-containing protein n=1 Tax=Streptomyces eurythermus TaxID=42237 RepID=UPI0036FBB438